MENSPLILALRVGFVGKRKLTANSEAGLRHEVGVVLDRINVCATDILVRMSHNSEGDVAQALMPAVSRLVSTPSRRSDAVSRPNVGTSADAAGMSAQDAAASSLHAEDAVAAFRCARLLESARATSLHPKACEKSGLEAPTLDPAESLRLVFISSLAKGADLIAVGVALEKEWGLHAVLPFDAERFKREDHASPDEQARFEAYLSRAETMVVMESPDDASGATQETVAASYGPAADFIVDHCDLLLAVWDGNQTTAPRGGTSDSIRRAIGSRKTVINIPACGDKPWELIAPGKHGQTGLDEILLDIFRSPPQTRTVSELP